MSKRHFSALLVSVVIVVLAIALLVPGQTGRDEPLASGLLLPDMGQRINDVSRLRVTLAGDRPLIPVRDPRLGESLGFANS